MFTNSPRVSAPFKELQNDATYFITKYSKLRKKIQIKNIPGPFMLGGPFLIRAGPF